MEYRINVLHEKTDTLSERSQEICKQLTKWIEDYQVEIENLTVVLTGDIKISLDEFCSRYNIHIEYSKDIAGKYIKNSKGEPYIFINILNTKCEYIEGMAWHYFAGFIHELTHARDDINLDERFRNDKELPFITQLALCLWKEYHAVQAQSRFLMSKDVSATYLIGDGEMLYRSILIGKDYHSMLHDQKVLDIWPIVRHISYAIGVYDAMNNIEKIDLKCKNLNDFFRGDILKWAECLIELKKNNYNWNETNAFNLLERELGYFIKMIR